MNYHGHKRKIIIIKIIIIRSKTEKPSQKLVLKQYSSHSGTLSFLKRFQKITGHMTGTPGLLGRHLLPSTAFHILICSTNNLRQSINTLTHLDKEAGIMLL